MRRFIYVVLDGVGVGALPDASHYADEDSNTLGNLSRLISLETPFLGSLGLGNITPIAGVDPVGEPAAFVGRLSPLSVGQDSTVGHWEQMGLVTSDPFPTYPEGFPREVIAGFQRAIGRGVLGNCASSGNVIMDALGDEHVRTGKPIVYTSADSVFQIAAHVDVVPLDTLYKWCETARALLVGKHGVARVIARPFSGREGSYVRTADRRDFSLAPPGYTYLDRLQSSGVPVVAVGKVAELFCGRGVDRSVKVASNAENFAALLDLVSSPGSANGCGAGLIFSNLGEFDTHWGHRNDVEGFANGLQQADSALAEIAALMSPGDRLLITADHGVDPTTPSTDHSREAVPLLVYPRRSQQRSGVYEGQFADAGATAFEYLTEKTADLGGRSVDGALPIGRWRRATPVQRTRAGTVAGSPGRVGEEEAKSAGRWLAANVGPSPHVAVVLGSGLSAPSLRHTGLAVPYTEVPGWRAGAVQGHEYALAMASDGKVMWAVMQGRIHEYEGFDLSEVQLPIRSMAAWGVKKLVLTSAGGAVSQDLRPGVIVACGTVIDLQYRAPGGEPVLLPATRVAVAGHDGGDEQLCDVLSQGLHASVPGPQYETPAELAYLQSLKATTVSMTPAGELRAAIDEQMRACVLTVVTNVGDTTHCDVLATADRSAQSLGRLLLTIGRAWV